MDMTQLMLLVKDRQKRKGLSVEKFANQIGVTSPALYHYYNGTRSMNLESVRIFYDYFADQNDTEMMAALTQYALLGDQPSNSN